MRDLERPSTYNQLLHETGLEVVEFEGFSGKELDNLLIIERNYQSLKLLHLCGMVKIPPFIKLVKQLETLNYAWRNGYFDLRRYFAVKPE